MCENNHTVSAKCRYKTLTSNPRKDSMESGNWLSFYKRDLEFSSVDCMRLSHSFATNNVKP
jgi:hypothetical protein